MSSPRSTRCLAVLLGALLLAACAVERTPTECLTEFTRAIQDRDAATLFCLSAGAAGEASLGADAAARREGFARWYEAEMLAYEEAHPQDQLICGTRGSFTNLTR